MFDTALFYAIAIGPAIGVLVRLAFTGGRLPDRDVMIAALVFTALMATQRTYVLNQRNHELSLICRQLEGQGESPNETSAAEQHNALRRVCASAQPAEFSDDE